MKTPKPKTCRECGKEFVPTFSSVQSVCGMGCAAKRSRAKQQEKTAKQSRKDKSEALEKLMTKGEWLKLAQSVFNTFIRLRDAGQKCISCDCSMQGRKGDASHYFPSTYSALRFDEDNVHLACVPCNQFKSGNLHEYRPRLIKKIGVARVKWLDDHAHDKFEITIDEIKELITEYRMKIKQLKTN